MNGEGDPLGIVQETNGICNNQNLSLKMKHMKFSRNLKYKRISKYRPEKDDKVLIIKKKQICYLLMDFAVQRTIEIEKKKKKMDKMPRAEKTVEYDLDGDTTCS